MGFNCTFAVVVGDVSNAQLARLGLHPTGAEVSLDETSRGSAGRGVGVARLGDFTVLTDGSLSLMPLLEDPSLVTGTWFITVSSSVTDTYEYRVIRYGSVERRIGINEDFELTESGSPVGDESGFTRPPADNPYDLDGEELLWILPQTSGLAEAHPGVELLDLDGSEYDFLDSEPEFVTAPGGAKVAADRPWWKFWG